MLQLALVDDGHRLEAAMRMLADTAARGGRGEVVRAGVVQQQERADVTGQIVIGEQTANRKAIPDPMAVRATMNTQNLFHEKSPLSDSWA